MNTARERILERLRAHGRIRPLHANPRPPSDAEWMAGQPPLGDLRDRFVREVEALGGLVRQVPDWETLPGTVGPWLAGLGVVSIMTGTEPRLEPLRQRLADQGPFQLRRYEGTLETQRQELFHTDCGITTSRGGIAETGSVVLVPTPEEPRLLSLAMPVHLVIVERAALYPTLSAFIDSGTYQREIPSNLVLVSGASRTADIELILVVGVHGPKQLLVTLVG